MEGQLRANDVPAPLSPFNSFTSSHPLAAASTAGASVPMGAQAEALYQMFANNGGGARDFSAIIKLLRG